jgi:DNA gyrase subunit A
VVLLSEAGVENQILIATKNGYAIRFPESELRDMGRSAMGVRGIRLRENDEVVDMILGNPETDVVTITNQGYGKRSKLSLYRETRRGGKGVININFHEENDLYVPLNLYMMKNYLSQRIQEL